MQQKHQEQKQKNVVMHSKTQLKKKVEKKSASITSITRHSHKTDAQLVNRQGRKVRGAPKG